RPRPCRPRSARAPARSHTRSPPRARTPAPSSPDASSSAAEHTPGAAAGFRQITREAGDLDPSAAAPASAPSSRVLALAALLARAAPACKPSPRDMARHADDRERLEVTLARRLGQVLADVDWTSAQEAAPAFEIEVGERWFHV